MVDKVWYDWQHANPANFWAFKGGSVQNLTSLQALQDWPNGMAPDLSVSHSLAIHSQVSAPVILDFQLNSTIPADGMFPEVSIGDVMNTTGGYLCYVYE